MPASEFCYLNKPVKRLFMKIWGMVPYITIVVSFYQFIDCTVSDLLIEQSPYHICVTITRSGEDNNQRDRVKVVPFYSFGNRKKR